MWHRKKFWIVKDNILHIWYREISQAYLGMQSWQFFSEGKNIFTPGDRFMLVLKLVLKT